MSDGLTLAPPIPAPRVGQRFTFSGLAGSADAALIAQTALRYRDQYFEAK